jgi:hypothetical protein
MREIENAAYRQTKASPSISPDVVPLTSDSSFEAAPVGSGPGVTLSLMLVAGLLAAHAFYYWMALDDSFIAFRYARNLLDGNGLVYNPGQYVAWRAIPPSPGSSSSRP